jgi:hypothetical protein
VHVAICWAEKSIRSVRQSKITRGFLKFFIAFGFRLVFTILLDLQKAILIRSDVSNQNTETGYILVYVINIT